MTRKGETGQAGRVVIRVDHAAKEIDLTLADPGSTEEAGEWKWYILDRQAQGYQVYYRQPYIFRSFADL